LEKREIVNAAIAAASRRFAVRFVLRAMSTAASVRRSAAARSSASWIQSTVTDADR
jgi:phosphatidylserine/phosphatidylglycerophosphate/cardiolipin synthase-like enzyme